MAPSRRFAVLLALTLATSATQVRGQQFADERPKPLQPTKLSPEDKDRSEAEKLYGLALLRQKQDRLVEAQHLFEEAAKLDPKALDIPKALVPIYLALGRSDDALAACKKTLELAPNDFDIWYLYARELRNRGQATEAAAALVKGCACSGIDDRLDLLLQMQFDLGNIYEETRDYAKAEQAYGAVAKIFETKPMQLVDVGPFSREQLEGEAAKTYERIGRVCTLAGKYDRAVAAYIKAQKHDPEQSARLSYNLAEVSLAQGRPKPALEYLDAYLKSQPQGVQAYELKIDVLKKLGREGDIVASLEADAARDAHNAPLQLLLARQYTVERKWDKAESVYDRLIREAPTAEVYRGLFTAYKDQRKLGKAIDVLDKDLKAAAPAEEDGAPDAGAAARARAMLQVLREEPSLVDGLLTAAVAELRTRRPDLGNPDGQRSRVTLRFLAVLAARAHKLDKAEALFTACLNQITPRTEAEVYGGLLEVLYQARKYAKVVDVAKAGLEQAQATNRVLFHRMLALSLAQLGKNVAAVKEADAAVRLAGEDDKLRLQLFRAEILREVEKYDDAVAACKELFEEHTKASDVRDIRRTLSIVYSSANEHAKAEDQLRQILEADPTDATANNDLGYIMADQGHNLDESERLVRRALELDESERKSSGSVDDGDNAAYLDSLGWVLFRKGQLEEAKSWLEKAVALPGAMDDPVVWDHLGDVYSRLEKTAKAREAWEKAAKLYEIDRRRKPDDRFKEVKHKLETLETEAKPR